MNNYETAAFQNIVEDAFQSILRIDNIDESDNGSFECVLTNEAGEDKKSFELLVQTSPKVDAILMKNFEGESEVEDVVSVLENNEVTFDCITEGYPLPEVTWFRDQEEDRIPGKENQITILQVREDHAGSYKCAAQNILGLAVKSFNLEVKVPPKIDESQQGLIKVVENEKVRLSCDL